MQGSEAGGECVSSRKSREITVAGDIWEQDFQKGVEVEVRKIKEVVDHERPSRSFVPFFFFFKHLQNPVA